MAELHTGPKHSQSSTDPESYLDLHVAHPGYQPKGECDCRYLAQNNQAYSGRVGLVSLGRLPTLERITPITNPRVEQTRQPWLAIHLGEGNSEFKNIVREICWHCPSLQGQSS